jgi:hypothetical protein
MIDNIIGPMSDIMVFFNSVLHCKNGCCFKGLLCGLDEHGLMTPFYMLRLMRTRFQAIHLNYVGVCLCTDEKGTARSIFAYFALELEASSL